jgi:hypothetical protein
MRYRVIKGREGGGHCVVEDIFGRRSTLCLVRGQASQNEDDTKMVAKLMHFSAAQTNLANYHMSRGNDERAIRIHEHLQRVIENAGNYQTIPQILERTSIDPQPLY